MNTDVPSRGRKRTPAQEPKRAASSSPLRECLDECRRCQGDCLEAVAHCEQQGGRFAEPNHVRLLLDCAEICRASAEILARGSPLRLRTCALCAEVCEQCAAECEAFDDDEVMRRCAATCHSCAAACRGATVGPPPA